MTSFIGQWFVEDKTICDDLIKFHKDSPIKFQGHVSGKIITSEKKSTDVSINNDNVNHPVIQRYLIQLKKVCDKYIEQYKWCNEYSPFMVTEGFNIQHYKPNEGYFAWHTERGSSQFPYCNRHLVWMTYLNDVTDDGETEFYYQGIKTKPKKGLTVIFPADWTHTHRGITSKTQDKYIITGWYNFINKGN